MRWVHNKSASLQLMHELLRIFWDIINNPKDGPLSKDYSSRTTIKALEILAQHMPKDNHSLFIPSSCDGVAITFNQKTGLYKVRALNKLDSVLDDIPQ